MDVFYSCASMFAKCIVLRIEILQALPFFVLFYRVVPQALCTRYGLAIGAVMAP